MNLGEALVKAGVLTPEQLKKASEKASKENAATLIISLLELEYLTFKVFEKFLLSTMGIKSAIVSGHELNPVLLTRVGTGLINSKLIFPISTREDKDKKLLALGMVDPTDEKTILKVEELTGWRVVPILISLPDFKEALLRNQPQELATQAGGKGRKFREEILAKLDLDPAEIPLLPTATYTSESLHAHIQKVSSKTLQKIYDKSSDEVKLDGLVNLLVSKGIISKTDILVSSAVSAVFKGGGDKK